MLSTIFGDHSLKSTIYFVTLFTAICAFASTNDVKQFDLPKIKLTIKILDETCNPVSNALVKLTLNDPVTLKSMGIEGTTDRAGDYLVQGSLDNGRHFGGTILKDGYYRSGFPFYITGLKDGRWQPWDTNCATILRPVGKPVAMYARTAWIEIPATNQSCGYDLEKSDWVAPYGKGLVADMIFNLKRRYANVNDFEVNLDVTFSNPLDGIQEIEPPAVGLYSVFKWPREALDSGYQTGINSSFSHLPNSGWTQSAQESQMFLFRIRAVERNGKIVSTLYGKIKGGFQLAPFDSKTSNVKLTYYLNPTPMDRNIEFDPKHNLFKNLSWNEEVREP